MSLSVGLHNEIGKFIFRFRQLIHYLTKRKSAPKNLFRYFDTLKDYLNLCLDEEQYFQTMQVKLDQATAGSNSFIFTTVSRSYYYLHEKMFDSFVLVALPLRFNTRKVFISYVNF